MESRAARISPRVKDFVLNFARGSKVGQNSRSKSGNGSSRAGELSSRKRSADRKPAKIDRKKSLIYLQMRAFLSAKKMRKKATILENIWHIILEKINFDLDSLKGEKNNGRKLFNWDGR